MRSTLFTVTLFVLSSTLLFCQQTVTLSNSIEVDDAILTSREDGAFETTNYGTAVRNTSRAWTENSLDKKRKFIFRFDCSSVPNNAIITSATITFKTDPTWSQDHGVNSSLTASNEMYARRVLADWSENTITWSNQPNSSSGTSSIDRIYIPESTSSHETRIVDITDMTQFFVSNPTSNYGMLFEMITASPYASRNYGSSENTSGYHPIVSITYTTPQSVQYLPFEETWELGNSWEQVGNNGDDWLRNSGNTPSSGTGPTGASDGSYYYYLETSSPNNPNLIFNSVSPNIFMSGSSQKISFDYHMNGTDMGDLSLDISTDGTNWTSLWTKSGNQGNIWQRATVLINQYLGSTVQFRFSGTSGSGYRSDMAIDNFYIQNAISSECSTLSLDTVEQQKQPWYGNNQYLEDFLDSINFDQGNCSSCRSLEGLPEPKYYLPVQTNILHPTNPNNIKFEDANQADVEEAIREANLIYDEISGTKIRFYLEPENNLIRTNDLYYDAIDRNKDFDDMTKDYFRDGFINYYFISTSKGEINGGRANRDKWYERGRPYSATQVTFYPPYPTQGMRIIGTWGRTLSHEIGHMFDLDHTHDTPLHALTRFNGELTNKCLQEPVSRTKNLEFYCFGNTWFSDNRKCAKRGDRICDTAGDPGSEDIGGVLKSSEDLYDVAWTVSSTRENIMSYGGNRQRFTRGQTSILHQNMFKFEYNNSNVRHGNPDQFDEFEPNNFQPRFRTLPTITLNESQHHSIHRSTDEDWSRFSIVDTTPILLFSEDVNGLSSTDTQMWLYSVDAIDGLTLIQFDDNSGEGTNSRIETTLSPGEYVVRISTSNFSTISHYNLKLFECFDASIVDIQIPNLICSTSNFTLQNVPSGATISWNYGSLLTYVSGQGTSTLVVDPNGNGTETVSATVTTSCRTEIYTVSVQVGVPIEGEFYNNFSYDPLYTFNSVIDGQTNVYIESTVADSYNWTLTSGTVLYWWPQGTNQNQMVFEIEQGNSASFNIQGIKTGCTTSNRTVTFSANSFSSMIYPNPVETNLYIDIEEPGIGNTNETSKSSLLNDVQVEIYDDTGLLIKSFKSNKKNNSIDVSELKPGLYLLKIIHHEGVVNAQIRKK